MENRSQHRHARVRHDREKKKRRANACGTTTENPPSFMASGDETLTQPKDIRSTICRLNKKVNEEKLSNTAVHALINHQNITNHWTRILPITQIIAEIAKFDTHRLINPEVSGIGYQQGDKMGFANTREYVLARDKYKCVYCKAKKKEPLYVHHMIHRCKWWLRPSLKSSDASPVLS